MTVLREPLFREISCNLILFLLFRFSLESQQYRRRKLKDRGYSGYPGLDRRAFKSQVILWLQLWLDISFSYSDLSFSEQK